MSLSTAVLWRCAIIVLIPLFAWTFRGPDAVTEWERAGDRHYKVRYIPGSDEACLILKFEHITPNLEPHTCWD